MNLAFIRVHFTQLLRDKWALQSTLLKKPLSYCSFTPHITRVVSVYFPLLLSFFLSHVVTSSVTIPSFRSIPLWLHLSLSVSLDHGCHMAIAGFLDRMCLALRASGLWLRYAAKFDPFLSLDCAPTPSTLAQSKERKGSNFAIWQPCPTSANVR